MKTETIKKIQQELRNRHIFHNVGKGFNAYEKEYEDDYIASSLWLLYYSSKNTEDFKLVMDLIKELDYENNSELLMLLAKMYVRGRGVEKDDKKAYELLKKAYSMGNCRAETLLGRLLYEGDGVEHDPIKAVNYLERAALNGDYEASLLMAEIRHDSKYEYNGIFDSQDRWAEYFWRELPIKAWNANRILYHAQNMIEHSYDKTFNKEEINKNLALASILGDDFAKTYLINAKINDDATKEELIEAYFWLSKIKDKYIANLDVEKEKESIEERLKQIL